MKKTDAGGKKVKEKEFRAENTGLELHCKSKALLGKHTDSCIAQPSG